MISGRERVIVASIKEQERLVEELKELISGNECPIVWSILIRNELQLNGGKRETHESGLTVYDIPSLRAVIDSTWTLNILIPGMIPLRRSVNEDISDNEISKCFDLCSRIGRLQYFIDHDDVISIVIQDSDISISRPRPTEAVQKYINEAANPSDYAEYLKWFWARLSNYKELCQLIDSKLVEWLDCDFSGLMAFSRWLEDQSKKNIVVSKNDLLCVAQQIVKKKDSGKLVESMTIGERKNLFRSPLIPLENGDLLIAKWIFDLGGHSQSWFEKLLADPGIGSTYGNVIGHAFEDYLEELLKPTAYVPQKAKEVDLSRYNVEKDGATLTGKKEVDLIAIKRGTAFIISCKGGRKNLPKSPITEMYAEFSPKEIGTRIEENKEEIKEIEVFCRILKENKRLRDDLGVGDRQMVPVICYSSVQPLAIEDVRVEEGVSTDVQVLIPSQLVELVKKT